MADLDGKEQMTAVDIALAESLRASFTRSLITPVEFAENVRRMEGGRRFSFDFAPYQREPFESIFDPQVEITVLSMFSRGGKTEIISNALGYFIGERPKRIIMGYPNKADAVKYSKDNFTKCLINPTPELEAKLPDGTGRRITSNTLEQKFFPGGQIDFLGVNTGYRTVKGNVVAADEIDAFTEEVSDEGDKVANLLGRADEFPDAVRILSSYPSVMGKSHIWEWLGESDWRQWFVQHKCGHEYVGHRNQLKWPKGKPAKAVLICPGCGGGIDDKERIAMARAGEWRATQPFRGIRGYQTGGMMVWPHPHAESKLSFLHEKAAEIERIQKSKTPKRRMRVMVNRFDAEPDQSEQMDTPKPSRLVERREDYSMQDIPEGVLAITFGGDLQGNWAPIEFVGHGRNGEEWGLGYHVVHGKINGAKFWKDVDDLVMKARWNHPKLGEMKIDGGCIDSRYKPELVREWTIKRRTSRIFAVIGSNVPGQVAISKPKRQEINIGGRRRLVTVYELGVDEIKDGIYEALELEQDEESKEFPAGYMHYPIAECYDEEYFEGLTCEVPEMKRGRKGKFYRHFENVDKARNEPLDVRGYARAARTICAPPIKARALKVFGKTGRNETKEGEFEEIRRNNRQNWATGATSLDRGRTN